MRQNQNISAIQTQYRGYRFRSRLEARWAVFFDTLGILWVYEKEGFDLGEHGWYLPDFWLPQVGMWAEVKPLPFSEEERRRFYALVLGTGFSGIMLDGVPSTRIYWGFGWYEDGAPPIPVDYTLQDGNYYWKTEHRFYANSGEADTWEVIGFGGHPVGCLCKACDLDGAVVAARSARFDRR